MQSDEIGTHISSQFNDELEDIRNQVLAMGRLVEQQITLAVQAFVNGDLKLAERVVQQEKQVDDYEVAIDEKCVQVHALRQPTAFDLRLLFAIVKTIAELERIGDLADSIAHATIHLADIEGKHVAHREVLYLAELVTDMLRGALRAIEHMDARGVPALLCRNEKADCEHVGLLKHSTAQMMADPHHIKRMLHVLASVRALENIGEHAANICHYVIYMVCGKDVRHLHMAEMQRVVQSSGHELERR